MTPEQKERLKACAAEIAEITAIPDAMRYSSSN